MFFTNNKKVSIPHISNLYPQRLNYKGAFDICNSSVLEVHPHSNRIGSAFKDKSFQHYYVT